LTPNNVGDAATIQVVIEKNCKKIILKLSHLQSELDSVLVPDIVRHDIVVLDRLWEQQQQVQLNNKKFM
jgi:hypothetical protein